MKGNGVRNRPHQKPQVAAMNPLLLESFSLVQSCGTEKQMDLEMSWFAPEYFTDGSKLQTPDLDTLFFFLKKSDLFEWIGPPCMRNVSGDID